VRAFLDVHHDRREAPVTIRGTVRTDYDLVRGDRFVTGAVLAADEGAANVSWFARGYGVAAYDLGTGEGVAVVRNTPEAPALLGQERLRRP
jgi:hypothetical protein